MIVDLEKVDSKLFNTLLGEQFAFNMQMYEYRRKRVLFIDTTKKENQMEYLMTFDAFIVLFRSLFLEKSEGCYTAQNYFSALGRDDIACRINAFLDRPFNQYSDLTIRKVLKFLADKFVCHLDPIAPEDLASANSLMATLGNPYVEVNLQYICSELDKIMNE